MIIAREEEKQMDWACSAQNNEMIPERMRKQDSLQKRQVATKKLRAYFE